MGTGSAILPPQYRQNQPQQGAGINQVRNWAQSNGLGRNAVQQYMAQNPAGMAQRSGGMVQPARAGGMVQQSGAMIQPARADAMIQPARSGGMVQQQPIRSDQTVAPSMAHQQVNGPGDLPRMAKGGQTVQPRPMVNPFN